ncbi:hypothetical protein [Paraburkholderia sediminicola]|uniref:hypothetical protein n=1 Tax=Paraburkholderia sediminicola TaxID=458836 RepID=UPI0038BDE3D7
MNNFDYAALSQELDATIREIHKAPMEKGGLANYFRTKYERKYQEYFVKQEKARNGFARGAIGAATASLASLGMLIATGPAIAPIAGVVSAAGLGYMVAETVRSALSEKLASKQIFQARDMIHAAAADQVAVWQADNRGGFLGRIYASVSGKYKGFDERVRNISNQLGKLDPSSDAYVQLVKETLGDRMDPEFKSYLRSTAAEKYSPAALLTQQMKAGLELRNEASVKQPAPRDGLPVWDVPKYASGAAGGVFAAAQAAPRTAERLDVRDLPNPPLNSNRAQFR